MDARCYHGAQGRTRLSPLAFTCNDGIAVAILIALLGIVIAVSNLL